MASCRWRARAKVGDAIAFQTELKTRETLDECEWMHISGDATVTAGFPGGQTDGLMKWILNNGKVVTPPTATAQAPVALAEDMIKDLFRQISQTFPTAMPNTVLIPPELKPDFNSFVGSGAGNPITRIISTDAVTQNLIAGSPEVTKYDTGLGVIDVRVEPNLSPLFNPLLTGNLYVRRCSTTRRSWTTLRCGRSAPRPWLGSTRASRA